MDQKKLYELAADLADGRALSPEEERTLANDPAFRVEHVEQSTVKNILSRASLYESAPPELRRSVITGINALRPREKPSILRLLIDAVLNPGPGFAVGLVTIILAVGGFWYFRGIPNDLQITDQALPTIADSEEVHIVPVSERDIVHQSAQTYLDFAKGATLTQFASTDKDSLRQFFRSHGVEQTVYFSPAPKNFNLVGGIVSEYNGSKLVHLVYQRDTTLICVLQTSIESLKKKGNGGLTAQRSVVEALKKEKPFMHNCSHCNIVIWKEQQTVYSAASKMPNNELLALVTH